MPISHVHRYLEVKICCITHFRLNIAHIDVGNGRCAYAPATLFCDVSPLYKRDLQVSITVLAHTFPLFFAPPLLSGRRVRMDKI